MARLTSEKTGDSDPSSNKEKNPKSVTDLDCSEEDGSRQEESKAYGTAAAAAAAEQGKGEKPTKAATNKNNDRNASISELKSLNQSKGEATIEEGSPSPLHADDDSDNNNGDNNGDNNNGDKSALQKSGKSKNEKLQRINKNRSSRLSRRNSNGSMRRMSRQLSAKLEPIKPETPLGWTAFLSTFASLTLLHEFKLQKKLTCPPLVYAQDNLYLHTLREMLAKDSKDGLSILTRNIQPSLFVGTRSVFASSAAYALHHSNNKHEEKPLEFREIMTMDTDGATIAVDWELPHESYPSSLNIRKSRSQRIAHVKYGPITCPVVIILHGINNDTSFGYMRSLMRSCTNHGWIACGLNFRGCGKYQMTTPRGYTAGFTGDLRNVIFKIQSRLNDVNNTPVFLVGNSLGANIITKYLGEEGYSGTLPKCIKGGVSLGNPLHLHGGNIGFPWNFLLGMGVKKILIENWKPLHLMSNSFHHKKAIRKAFFSKTIGQFDESMSPFFIRNESQHPFKVKVGFEDGEDYWHDSSSNRYIQHVSVPLLLLTSQDDFLVADHARRSLSKCLSNPNVLVVKTKCGGHLGWQEAPPSGTFGVGKSWADTAMADFFSSVLETEDILKRSSSNSSSSSMRRGEEKMSTPAVSDIVESMYSSKQIKSKL